MIEICHVPESLHWCVLFHLPPHWGGIIAATGKTLLAHYYYLQFTIVHYCPVYHGFRKTCSDRYSGSLHLIRDVSFPQSWKTMTLDCFSVILPEGHKAEVTWYVVCSNTLSLPNTNLSFLLVIL